MKKIKFIFYSFTVFMMSIIFLGCPKKVSMLSDREAMEEVVSRSGFSIYEEVPKNLDLMISQFENQKINPEPVIVIAALIGTEEINPKGLNIFCYDEDKDVIGIGIKEKYTDSNGIVTNLIEEYPVAYFRKYPTNIPALAVPIDIRNSNQRKSEKDWKDYIDSQNIVADNRQDWYSTLPIVWISMPEPNKTEVEVYVYDRGGHKSNSTKVHFSKSKSNVYHRDK